MEILAITDKADWRIGPVPALLEAMYAEMAGHGPVRPLAPGGAQLWLSGVVPGLERFCRLSVAVQDGEVLGFGHGAVKLLPEHLGGHPIGHISHLHVKPEFRRQGIARSLAASLEEWFAARQTKGVEIQLVAGNARAAAFWERLGYRVELLQYLKPR